MPDPRPQDQRAGPRRPALYAHRHQDLHDRVVTDDSADEAFPSGISNRGKADYLTQAIGLDPALFHLDLPLPVDDWSMSEDASKLNAGLYLSDLRRQFFLLLFRENPHLLKTEAWAQHAEAEFWCLTFNRVITQRNTGYLVQEQRNLQ